MNKITAILIGAAIGTGISYMVLPPNPTEAQVQQVQEDWPLDWMLIGCIPVGFLLIHELKK